MSTAATVIEGEGLEPPLGGDSEILAEVEHGVFPPFDPATFGSQLLWLAITFAILYYVMARVALPRIAGILEDRRGRVANDLDMAERLKVESEEAIAGYEGALAEARARAFAIAEAAREEAKAAADARRAAIEADLAGKLAAAEARIAEIKAQALTEVGGIAAEAAGAIVEALTDAGVARGDVDKAVAEAMRK
jgi:F-type H+-transporting ATPase subunit b